MDCPDQFHIHVQPRWIMPAYQSFLPHSVPQPLELVGNGANPILPPVSTFQLMYATHTASERCITDLSFQPPPEDNEVFIGNIPNNIFELDIYSLFGRIGPIYKVRVKMNLSGECKGYGFVHYYKQEDANRAILMLRDFKFNSSLESGIIVDKASQNSRLFVKRIPKHLDAKDIYESAIRISCFSGLVKVDCRLTRKKRTLRNWGYCILEFDTHRTAINVLHILSQNPTMFFEGYSVIASLAKLPRHS